MKFNYLIKATPFLSTLFLIIILSISNQKENTKLKILIWNTPTLTLGTYLAISTGTGFILSYLINTNLARIKQSSHKKILNFKQNKPVEVIDENSDTISDRSFDKTLIERAINDPLPTINASFRVVGRTERKSNNFISNNNLQYNELVEEYYEQQDINGKNDDDMSVTTDWNDESFLRW
tara:strand:- start:1727 stop:2263 length:537 start_codon:yes stop_codon:yes gene_type:complete